MRYLLLFLLTGCIHVKDNKEKPFIDSVLSFQRDVDTLGLEALEYKMKLADMVMEVQAARGSEIKLHFLKKDYAKIKKDVDSLRKENKFLKKKDSIYNSIHYFESRPKYHF